MADKTAEQELNNLFEDKRSFIHDGEKYYIDNASIDEVRKADWHYSKTFNEALLEGVATMAQMEEILEEREVIGKKYNEKRLVLLADLDEKVAKLGAATSLDEKKLLAVEVEDARNKVFKWNQRASSPMSQSCEQLADDARVEYLTASMVKNDKGEKVWKSYEDYKTTINATLAVRARYECLLALSGMPSNFMELTPEAIAKKEVAEEEQKLITSEPASEPTKKKK